MYKVAADPARNRLELLVGGRISLAELIEVRDAVAAELQRLKPGYLAAIDLRSMQVLMPDQTEVLAEVQAVLMRAEPARIGTLVASSTLELQINRIGTRTTISQVAHRFTDEAEWRAYVS